MTTTPIITSEPPTPPRRFHRPTLRYRISAVLLALAILPLSGVAWFAVVDVSEARAARAQAESVDAAVARLALLTELKSRLQDERNWSAASKAIDQIGVSPELSFRMSGVDIAAEQTRAVADVDRLVATLGLDDVAQQLQVARSTPAPQGTLFTIGRDYDLISTDVAARGQLVIDELTGTAGRMRGGEGLIRTLRVLEAATTAQESIAAEFTAYFGVQFSSRDLNSDLRVLLGEQRLREIAEGNVRRIAGPNSRARTTIDTIDDSSDVDTFDASVDKLLLQAQATGSEVKDDPMSRLAADGLDTTLTMFRASQQSTILYFDLVNAAGSDALGASSAVSTSAERQVDRALASAAALAGLSFLLAAWATRAIVGPVRRLAEVAGRISDGDSTARFGGATGSVEIRAAGRAMDAAAAHLELAEQQAKALAEGDLDHPVLKRATTGQLGASLQDAVEALASSLQEREEFRRRMTHEATHDGLTQIANRNASLAQLRRGMSRVRRSGSMLAVLFIDLDGFKDINDTHGHHAGDLVLRSTAQRLVNTVRDGDHVGRLGGDEFLVIAEPVAGIDEAVALAERLLAALSEPMPIDQGTVSVRASIGIALSDGTAERGSAADGSGDSGDADSADLLRDADLAVYKAKAEGRARVEICDDELRSTILERADLERALRQAIDELEFVLHYQPIIDADSETLRGFEALIRWNRPGHGMMPPDLFIPVAERSDLIIAVDQWVMGAAARQLAAWEAEGRFRGLPVSVNISGRHLASPDLVDDVLSPLRDNRVDPTRLIVEITESALLEDLGSAAVKLQVLRDHGIRVAIDDFGTGYTSLAHLKSLPIDILKIDRSYTSDNSSASLVKLIIDTGHLLGATITAEGIETPAQATALAGMGTDELQGYLYGRPRPPGELGAIPPEAAASRPEVGPMTGPAVPSQGA
ncbi:MAG: bifunctional diguanylate cyclase/phosphodiesterase [Acidimicrobiales bacterium]